MKLMGMKNPVARRVKLWKMLILKVVVSNYQPGALEQSGTKWFHFFLNIFLHLPGEMIQFDLRMFFKWVVKKPTNHFPFVKIWNPHPIDSQRIKNAGCLELQGRTS